jgi:hypothetical protein
LDCRSRDRLVRYFWCQPVFIERDFLNMLFAYFAPEVVLPVASVVTATIGFIMMVGRAPFRIAARGVRSGWRGVKNRINKLNL